MDFSSFVLLKHAVLPLCAAAEHAGALRVLSPRVPACSFSAPADGVRAQGFLKSCGEPQEIFIKTQYAILFYIGMISEYSFFYLCDSVVCLLRLLTSICVQC